MTETWLSLANYGFLALLYAFLFWTVHVIARGGQRSSATESRARLLIESELEAPRTFTLAETATLGRLPHNEIVVEDTAVSGRHARITRRRGRWWLEDLDSSNGTWLNEVRLDERLRLDDGDRVRLGRTTITVDLSGVD